MWVAHLFSDKVRMRCHRSPEFCNGSDLQPTRTLMPDSAACP